jgi:hypothetical protein
MRHSFLKQLSLWILPLLLARALIPSGFMLSVEAGRLQLMFCPSGVVLPVGKVAGAPSAHAGHHADMHHAGMHPAGTHHADMHAAGMHQGAQPGSDADQAPSSHLAQDSAPCPFSLVASATPCSIAHFTPIVADLRDERFQFFSAPAVQVGPIRTDRARGPPSLA